MLSFTLLLPLLFSSCTKESTIEKTVDELLINEWVHSYEEDTVGDRQTYRPFDKIGYPLSRGRRYFVLQKNKECAYLELAPNDAHQQRTGSWELVSGAHLILRNKSGETVTNMEIFELTADRLILSSW